MLILKNLISEELKELDALQIQAETFLATAPDGSLRVSATRRAHQYYWVHDPKKRDGDYIRKERHDFACSLAQKAYAEKFLIEVKKSKRKLITALSACDFSQVQVCYENLSAQRKKLVSPYILPDEDFLKEWYQTNEDLKTTDSFLVSETGIFTEKKEEVRSKSEKIIADKLYMMNIPYSYEVPLTLNDFGTVHPDFTVLNLRTRQTFYWEHFGLMHNEDYCENAIQKIQAYQRNSIFPGKNLIQTYETNHHPLNTQSIEELIYAYLV